MTFKKKLLLTAFLFFALTYGSWTAVRVWVRLRAYSKLSQIASFRSEADKELAADGIQVLYEANGNKIAFSNWSGIRIQLGDDYDAVPQLDIQNRFCPHEIRCVKIISGRPYGQREPQSLLKQEDFDQFSICNDLSYLELSGMAIDSLDISDDFPDLKELVIETSCVVGTLRLGVRSGLTKLKYYSDGGPAPVDLVDVLSHASSLRSCDLSGQSVPKTVLTAVQRLQDLRWLTLKGSIVPASWLSRMACRDSLEVLRIDGVDADEALCETLRSMVELRVLDINIDGLADGDFGELFNSENSIEMLILRSPLVSDDSTKELTKNDLLQLRDNKKLKVLSIPETAIDADVLNEIRLLRPDLWIQVARVRDVEI
ncbi:MAG: hypothetical protein R3C20_15925 [Planctomycetaceae bacterium]